MIRFHDIFFCIVFTLATTVQADGLRYDPPVIGQFHPLREEPASPSVLWKPVDGGLLTINTTLFEDREVVDFEKREIFFERVEKNFNIVVWQYRYDELDAYLESRRRFALLNAWYKNSLSLLSQPPEKKKSLLSSLQWELPVQYPSWAQRVLGKDPPRLSMSGYEKIIISYENSNTDLTTSNQELRPSNSLMFDQENQFSITGSVGRLINLNIQGSTKQNVDVNDPLKNFKIEYKGDGNELEDEIVQEVSAGYTSFDMPKTSLSGFSQSHEGLFGIRVNSKLGPLALTSIASIEKGESQKATLSPSGQGESGSQMSERDYVRNKLFFLDTKYLNRYCGDSTIVPKVKELQLWLTNERIRQESSNSNTNKSTEVVYRTDKKTKEVFRLLKERRDYFLQSAEGWIRFDSISIEDNDKLGLYMVTEDTASIPVKGSDFLDTTTNDTSTSERLWLLKKQDMDSSYTDIFPLMWRNVYQMPNNFDLTKCRVRVVRTPDTTIEKTAGGRFFSEVLGLTDDKGSPLATNSQIYDVDHGLIILPVRFTSNAVARGNEPFSNDVLGEDNVNREIYRKTGTDYTNIVPKYKIMMSGSSRKTTFTLGFGSVMEGTEVLKVGGDLLEKTTDYIIDYQMGQVDLISKKAQSADKIDVEYQSESLFMPKQKVFLGTRGEIKLPIGEKSFVGTSVLWQDAASREKVPKINQEPYSKLLLDFNAQIDVEPEWMTSAVNLLPLISTDAKSSVALEVEVAHSRTNPNTDGQAYVDDFESSKETYPLGLSQTSWYQASWPTPYQSDSSLLHHPPAWIQYWYAPGVAKQELKTQIWDTITDRNQVSTEKYEPTLNFECQPAPPDSNPYRNRFDKPWGGIMTYFPAGTCNREKDKYFEFWAKNTGGGRMYIDLGTVSEDISLDGGPPNGTLDLEDKNNTGIITNDSLNNGLDGRKDTAEYYCVPTADYKHWDTLGYWRWDSTQNNRVVNQYLPYPRDPSKDKYQTYSETGKDQQNNFPFVDGTEGDLNLNSEDLNADGFRQGENIFRRYIDFDSASSAAFLDRNLQNYKVDDVVANANRSSGWHLYRVPLNVKDSVHCQSIGSPKWNEIKYIRIWWDNFSEANKSKKNMLQFARMQFVGNQWLEVPVMNPDSSKEVKLAVSTINTEENAKSYDPPPGVPRERDDRGNLAKETSLSLTYKNIQPGSSALVRKNLSFQQLNLSAYESLTMMVHSDTARQGLWYFFRFGTDDSTYYEARMSLDEDRWKALTIRLRDLSEMKRKAQIDKRDTVDKVLDSMWSGNVKLSVRRNPSFSSITWMSMGVMRDSTASGSAWNGEIWVDEMKVTGIKPLNGWAGRVSLTTKWADFMNLNFGLDYEDGSFRRMTETQLGLDNSQLSANFSVDWDMDKFLPEQWGVNIPLGTRMQQSLTRPQIKPNSDIYLTLDNGSADGLLEMYQEALSTIFGTKGHGPETASRHYQTTSFSQDIWTGFDKKTGSKNPFVNLALERPSVDFSYSIKNSVAAKGQLSGGGGDKLDLDTIRSYHGTLKYSLTPSLEPKYYKFKPFEQSKLLWLPDRVKNYEFSYLPTTLTFDVGEATYSKQTTIRGITGDTTHAQRLELDHRMNLVYDPINILNFTYNLVTARNLDSAITATNLGSQWKRFLMDNVAQMDKEWGKYGVLYGERSRTQGSTRRFSTGSATPSIIRQTIARPAA
jgi:hypothetical protein